MTSAAGAAGHPFGRAECGLSLLVLTTVAVAARTQPYWGAWLRLECVLLQLTGIPCPTCGGTRAIVALAQGDVVAALAWNPLVSLVGLAAAVWAAVAAGVVGGVVAAPTIPVRLPAWMRWAVPLAVAANWAWLLVALPR